MTDQQASDWVIDTGHGSVVTIDQLKVGTVFVLPKDPERVPLMRCGDVVLSEHEHLKAKVIALGGSAPGRHWFIRTDQAALPVKPVVDGAGNIHAG